MATDLSVKEHANQRRENLKVETVAYLLTRLQKATVQAHEFAHDTKVTSESVSKQIKPVVPSSSILRSRLIKASMV